PSQIGTWKTAIEIPCSPPDQGKKRCIAGGFSLLGETGLEGLADGLLIKVDPAPLRPVILSPFYLDEAEFTVGEFDALLAAQPGAITEEMPPKRDPSSSLTANCSWLGGKAGTEHLPLNCVPRKTAAQICGLRGGLLPSEAQWEHAARGRGQHRKYPWGDDEP